jgi:hypothetical protein
MDDGCLIREAEDKDIIGPIRSKIKGETLPEVAH